jgi:hypothetical protein
MPNLDLASHLFWSSTAARSAYGLDTQIERLDEIQAAIESTDLH